MAVVVKESGVWAFKCRDCMSDAVPEMLLAKMVHRGPVITAIASNYRVTI